MLLQLFTVLQTAGEATGEFDPIGTLIVLVAIILLVYAAWRAGSRGTSSSGVRSWGWRLGALVSGVIALIAVVALAMNVLAAIGLR